MADKEKPAGSSGLALPQALLAPLPRLRSLVVTELRGFAEKNPVDFNVFGRVFALTAGLLLLIFSVFSYIQSHRERVIAIREGRSPAAQRVKLIEKPAEAFQASKLVISGANLDLASLDDRQKAAITNNDKLGSEPLGPAPIAELEEPMGGGAAPRISDDGRKPWFAYSRPFDRADPRPRITVVVGELGLARIVSETAINDLPGAISLAFSAQGPATDAWMLRARSRGHETVLSLPMEPLDYPLSDPGPGTLLTKNSSKQNIRLLQKHLQGGKGYVGLVSFSGSRMASTPAKLRPVLDEVAGRGLVWLDAKLTTLSSAHALAKELGLPAVRADFLMGEDLSPGAMETMLKDVETTARQNGKTVLVVQASPLTIAALKEWSSGLAQKNISLAPLTAAAE